MTNNLLRRVLITCKRCPCASHSAGQLTWGEFDCPCHDHQGTDWDEYERY